MVIWLIGLSGAGKTTLAHEVVRLVKPRVPQTVLVDGDEVRAMWGDTLDHSLDGRRRNADRIVRLCAWLDGQGQHVVCAILSIFEEHRTAMRAQASAYTEVFVDTPMEVLRARDGKGLYAGFARGEITGVAGCDIPFPAPTAPDLHIRNDGDQAALLAHAPDLAGRLG
ncbi:MAG: adenylyl-sulfate kinase [Shimia sp.]